MILDFFLHSAGIVSAAEVPPGGLFSAPYPVPHAGKLLMREPHYSGLILPMQLRRMNKAVRTGIAGASTSLASGGLKKPDAIAIGTAMGCLHDTEVFLSKMVEQDEQLLSPTAFIQSTHNTVSGAIALHTGCTGYNVTIAHRGHSFEHALVNAALYLAESPDATVLVGGIDELTETSHALMRRAGAYAEGVVAGEGACFMLATRKPPKAARGVRLHALQMLFSGGDVVEKIQAFIGEHSFGDAVLLLQGANGDARADELYAALRTKALSDAQVISFKEACGDYPTAASFALAALVDGVAHGQIAFGQVVILNHWLDAVACYLIEVV